MADTSKSVEPEVKYLVYIWSQVGPQPQLWHGDQSKGTGVYQHKPVGAEGSSLLYFRKLDPEDAELDFHQLVRKYPYVAGFTKHE